MANAREPGASRADGVIRRIVVASDLTAHFDRAFDRAVMLAEENGAEICCLHAVETSALPASHLSRVIHDAQTRLEHEVRESGIGKRLDVSVKVVGGDADSVVVDEGHAMQAELIVMADSRDARLSSIFRGTVVDRVVRRARCPVLIVKTRPRRRYAKIAVAVDLAEPSRQALDFTLRAFPSAQITVVHVDEASLADRTAGAAQHPAGLELRHHVEDLVSARCLALGRDGPGSANGPVLVIETGRAISELPKLMARLAPELVVFGTHGRSGVSSLLVGSVAESLLEALPQDVLVSREFGSDDHQAAAVAR